MLHHRRQNVKVIIIQLVFLKYVLDRTLIGYIPYRKHCSTKGIFTARGKQYTRTRNVITFLLFCQVPASLLGIFNPYSAQSNKSFSSRKMVSYYFSFIPPPPLCKKHFVYKFLTTDLSFEYKRQKLLDGTQETFGWENMQKDGRLITVLRFISFMSHI